MSVQECNACSFVPLSSLHFQVFLQVHEELNACLLFLFQVFLQVHEELNACPFFHVLLKPQSAMLVQRCNTCPFVPCLIPVSPRMRCLSFCFFLRLVLLSPVSSPFPQGCNACPFVSLLSFSRDRYGCFLLMELPKIPNRQCRFKDAMPVLLFRVKTL